MPATFLCVVFFWTIYRPDLLGPVLILILASLLDAIAGLPLGLSALAFLAVRTAAMPRERNFASTSFVIVWASFVLAAMAVLGLRWAIACLWFAHWFDLQPVAVELALTVASYPPIAYMLTKLRPLVAKVPHVSGS